MEKKDFLNGDILMHKLFSSSILVLTFSHEKDHDQTNAEDRLVKMEKGSKEPQQSFARAR